MFKKGLAILLILMITLVSLPVMAADEPVIYKSTITMSNEGGRFQVGFINLEFKKDFLSKDEFTVTFDVEIYANNGAAYIEVTPDTPKFFKKVHIRVDSYQGLLYDKAKGENIKVDIKKQQILAEHFSVYAFR